MNKKFIFIFVIIFSSFFIITSCDVVSEIIDEFKEEYFQDENNEEDSNNDDDNEKDEDNGNSELINFSHLGNHRDEMIRYVYTAYNIGAGRSIESLIDKANDPTYNNANNVLYFYKYLIGEEPLENIKPLVVYDEFYTSVPFDGIDLHFYEPIQNYILDTVNSQDFQDNNHSNFLLKTYDQVVPINPKETDKKFNNLNPELIKNYPNRTFLINRTYDLLKYYHNLTGVYSFGRWFKEFHKEEYDNYTDIDIHEYAEFLVDLAYSYTHNNMSLPYNRKSNFIPWKYGNDSIIFNNIPIEMLLATLIQESRLFPGSFRAETQYIDGEQIIYAISFGLSHTLIDAHLLPISKEDNKIGLQERQSRNFNIISSFYLGNNSFQENYFSHWDLLSIRGSYIYSLAYLELVYRRFYEEWFILQ